MRKFAFDTEFAPPGGAPVRETAPAVRRMTPAEIETERQAGYVKGKEDAAAAAERATAAALADLAKQTGALLNALQAERALMRNEAAALAIAAARKIAGAALDAFGEERALAAIDAAMEALRNGPRLIVRIPAASADTLKPRIEELAAQHAYAGAVLVRAEPSLSKGAVAIDWSDGVVTLDPNEISERIETLTAAVLHGAAEGDAP